jgi:serine/threonine protein kinase
MGSVWLARDRSLGRDVALKLLRAPDAESVERARRRFEREARILAAAEHPSILPVWRRGEDPSTGLSFYAAKACLLSGADVRRLCSAVFGCPLPRDPARWDAAPRALTLADLLEGGKALPPRAVARIGEDLAGAIAAAHALAPPAVHRDVKPGNILFERDGRAVLADFGIASRAAASGAAAPGGFAGTPGYAAPEQLRGAPPAPAMDWYALGAVLFEALAGERPRAGAAKPSAYDPRRISRRWDALLAGLLEPDPVRRLADGPAIVAALRALQFSRRDRALQWGVAVLHAFAALAFLLGMILWIVSKKLLASP